MTQTLRGGVTAAICVLTMSGSALAQDTPPIQGRVAAVSSAWATNAYGDQTIVTTVLVDLPGNRVPIEFEGGTMGDITLTVSGVGPIPKTGDLVWVGRRSGRWRLFTDDFATFARWAGSSLTWVLDALYAEMTPAHAEHDLQLAALAWHDQTQASFTMQYGGRLPDGSGVQAFDQRNVVLFRPTTNPASPGSLASTYAWTSNGVLVDADIIGWSGQVNWASMDETCGSATNTNVYLIDVATHEFGHMSGLSHSSDPDATMYPSYFFCSSSGRSLSADDIAAEEFLYPPGETPPPPSTDTVAPVVTLSVEEHRLQVNRTVVEIRATATDAGSGVETIGLFKDGLLLKTCTESPCVIRVGLTDETLHQFVAVAHDGAGNVGTSDTIGFVR